MNQVVVAAATTLGFVAGLCFGHASFGVWEFAFLGATGFVLLIVVSWTMLYQEVEIRKRERIFFLTSTATTFVVAVYCGSLLAALTTTFMVGGIALLGIALFCADE